MTSLIHTLKTKGLFNTIRRVGMITSRYSFNSLMKSLRTIINILEDFDVKATLPITAITLRRNRDLIKELKSKKIEWAMHGFIHTDYNLLTNKELTDHILSGKKIFNDAGIRILGFRAPYLSINKKIYPILSENGFIYDSSTCYFVDIISSQIPDIKRILDYYKPITNWKISRYNGIVEIPVSLPDDEILVDRLRCKREKIGKAWIKLSQNLMKNGGLPVIQLHPERGRICKTGVETLLDWARKNDIRILPLEEIAKKNVKDNRTIAITGDIDIIKISDLRHMKRE